MKLVVAIIRPETLNAVQAALDIPGTCVASVGQAFGDDEHSSHTGVYRGAEFRVRALRQRLEIVATDWLVEAVVAAIMDNARTSGRGDVADAKVLVLPLADGHGSAFQDEENLEHEHLDAGHLDEHFASLCSVR